MNESKVIEKSTWDMWSGSDYSFPKDSSLFSSSLPDVNNQFGSFEAVQNHAIENMLPDDDDDLLAGIMDGFDFDTSPHHMDNLEEYDLFGSGGGLEIESDARESLGFGMSRLTLSDAAIGNNGMAHFYGQNSTGNVTGEHPLGEHPSRTLFVRNINSNVEDSELKELFQVYGDIRTLYTACKHRGFVMISYYDIRSARAALRALQNKPLRRRKLDIHFSIPKDNPSDKDLNQGTLVVFNLDSSVSNEDLLQIFGAYGEVKEIRETPHKRHHKFIEYYDVRSAEAALRSLNRREIAGKRIKLELSRPGGTRRNIMVHSVQDLEPDETPNFHHHVAASFGNSPPGNWLQLGSPIEQAPMSSLSKSADFRSFSPILRNMSALDSIFHPRASKSMRDNMLNNGNSGYRSAFQQSLSFHESNSSQFSGSGSSFGASNSNGSGIETLWGPQFLWGSSSSPKMYSEPPTNSPSLRGQSFGHHSLASNELANGFSFSGPMQAHRPLHHHVGSAPSGAPFMKHAGFNMHDFRPKDMSFTMNIGARSNVSSSVSISENGSSSGYSVMPSPRNSPTFLGYGRYPGIAATSLECSHDTHFDNTKSFELDLEKIKSGEDSRTTLMIKNIPNKYTSNMLLADIDENNKGTYDFLYLPIDFKNRCNVGYAFINMLSPSHIIPFYEAFNGRKWEKFNSEKVACLAYGRIQGKSALVSHFQNSSLMNEDKPCRPILFYSQASDYAHQGNFPSNGSNVEVNGSNCMDTISRSPKEEEEEGGWCSVDQSQG